jgi:predicted Co/Zn/Cd cation transporter (cation efflux family)
MSLIAMLLVVQIWLLSATLDSYLAGRHSAALPAAIISGLILACCFALYIFVERIDRKVRKQASKPDLAAKS